MSLRRFHIAALAAAALSASGAAVAVAGPWALAPGEYYTELRGRYYSTGQLFDDAGDRFGFDGLLERRDLRSYTELGWKKNWSAQFSLPAASRTLRLNSGPNLTSSGFGDFGFGLRRQFTNGASAKSLQLWWEGSSGYNRELAPGLGDGLQKLSATYQLGGTVGTAGCWQLGGGLRFRYDSASELWNSITLPAARWLWPDHVTTNGALAMWFGQVQVAGLFATELSSYPAKDHAPFTTVVVGPRLSYQVDDRLEMIAGMWHTPSGRNARHADTYYAGFGWRSTKLNRQQGVFGNETDL